MDQKPKRLSPARETYRELFLKSGNQCAFPGCNAVLIEQDGTFVGQLCHIEAAEPGGERFNSSMTNDERRGAPNLMLMCYPHHRVTNDMNRYSVADLRDMKAAHETRFCAPDRELRERLTKLNWTVLLGAGIAAGVVLDDITRHITGVLAQLVGSDEQRPRPLRLELAERLRYAPSGAIYWYSQDPANSEAAKQLLAIFESAGWAVAQLPDAPRFEPNIGATLDRGGLIIFVIGDKNQLSNARQAILDFFQSCGFSPIDQSEEAALSDREHAIRFHIIVVPTNAWRKK